LTLRIISTPLVGGALTRAALAGSTPANWYVGRPRGADGWRTRAVTIRGNLVSSDWLSPLMDAFAPSGFAVERLNAAARDGFVVTAGQQPGLFGGPMYTWWKALSIRAFADALSTATGLPVAPVFWAATDDSDLVEASSTVVATADGARRIALDNVDDQGLPLSLVPLGDISRQREELVRAAGSAPHPAILDVLTRAYGEGETVGSAYIKLLRSVLAPLGVAVIDASHPAVRAQAEGVLRRALERMNAVEAALFARDADLEASGYKSQVQTVKGRSLVFATTDGRRVRVSASHAAEVASGAPSEALSPNVLLRPIVERSILPTVAYLGGPAEIAYFAQVSAVAAALETECPLILPRWSGVVIEPRIQRILDKYKLAQDDFSDPHAVETRLARDSMPDSLKTSIDELRRAVEARIGALESEPRSDIVSRRVIEGLRRNMLHRVERLERRYSAAIKREGNEALHDVAMARASLYPLGIPQERALNAIPLIARFGDELFNSVMTEATPHAASLV
jgi:bacillithiol synthase